MQLKRENQYFFFDFIKKNKDREAKRSEIWHYRFNKVGRGGHISRTFSTEWPHSGKWFQLL